MLLIAAIALLLALAVTATLVTRSPVYRIFAYTIDHWADDIHGVENVPLRRS